VVRRDASRAIAVVGVGLALALAGCSSGPAPAPDKPHQPMTHRVSLVDQARQLAHADHTRRYSEYLSLLHGSHRRCRIHDPQAFAPLVESTAASLISYQGKDLSRLSVLRSLAAGIAPKGPPAACVAVAHALVHELRPSRRPPTSIKFGVHGFDPPVSQALALAAVRTQLLPPGRLRVIYSLDMASNCSETVYLSPRIERLMSSAAGVQVELTSGRGISSHYDRTAVNRARLSVGRGALGGQPCV